MGRLISPSLRRPECDSGQVRWMAYDRPTSVSLGHREDQLAGHLLSSETENTVQGLDPPRHLPRLLSNYQPLPNSLLGRFHPIATWSQQPCRYGFAAGHNYPVRPCRAFSARFKQVINLQRQIGWPSYKHRPQITDARWHQIACALGADFVPGLRSSAGLNLEERESRPAKPERRLKA